MRTTLNIDDEALEYAKKRARITGMSLGQVVSEALLDKTKPKGVSIEKGEHGFPVIRTQGDSKITQDTILEIIQEEDGLPDALTRS